MPDGKPAGIRCVQLDDQQRCRLFGRPERPTVCSSLPPSQPMCGQSREQALAWLGQLERASDPAGPRRPLSQRTAERASTRDT